MRTVKGSAALVCAAATMLIFLTGCETTKHAEIISDEKLAAQPQASDSQDTGSRGPAGKSGMPLGDQGMSERSLLVSDSIGAETGPAPEKRPEEPPFPTLREMNFSSTDGDRVETSPANADRDTQPSRFDLPKVTLDDPRSNQSRSSSLEVESPPQAYLKNDADPSPPRAQIDQSLGSHRSAPIQSDMDMDGTSGSDHEIVRLPDQHDAESLMTDGTAPIQSDMDMDSTSDVGHQIVRLPDQYDAESLMTDGTAPIQSDMDMDGTSDVGHQIVRPDLGSSQEDRAVSLNHVYFDFDQYSIRDDAISILQVNAQLLKTTYQDFTILIEGYCDERGTSEYNLVLGERRAQAIKNYLVDLGVSSSRIQIASYGKERPICTELKESCLQKNRRGHFVLHQ